MVQLDIVRSSVSTLVKSQPLVAVFVGGTSGIGEYTVKALAAKCSDSRQGLHVYIVGRNTEAAKKTISECSRLCQRGKFDFVQAKDLALLKDVDRVCAEITSLEEKETPAGGDARVDLLVMSQAFLSFEPRRETKEGLDTQMSLLYYSRMRFIIKLLPLLLSSQLPAHIISVYAAGKESNLFPEDLSLRDPKHYGFANARSHVTYMTTFFMENLAERHRERLSLVHVFPSVVITSGYTYPGLPMWFKLTWRLVGPIMRPFSIPPDECGDRTLFLATPRYPARKAIGTEIATSKETGATEGKVGIATGTDGNRGSGAYSVNWNGETIDTQKKYKEARETDLAKRVWNHTMNAFEEIEAGNVFTA